MCTVFRTWRSHELDWLLGVSGETGPKPRSHWNQTDDKHAGLLTERLSAGTLDLVPDSDKLHSSVTSHHYAILLLRHAASPGGHSDPPAQSSVPLLRYFCNKLFSSTFVFSQTLFAFCETDMLEDRCHLIRSFVQLKDEFSSLDCSNIHRRKLKNLNN